MADTRQRPKKYTYKNSISWTGEKKGILSSSGKPPMEVATPPEFKGHEGYWSPEDLFVASANICLNTTFLHYAEKNDFEILSYQSEAEGVLENVEGKFMFSTITIRPKITVARDGEIEKAKELLEISEKRCLITNSMKTRIEVIPEIKAGGD